MKHPSPEKPWQAEATAVNDLLMRAKLPRLKLAVTAPPVPKERITVPADRSIVLKKLASTIQDNHVRAALESFGAVVDILRLKVCRHIHGSI